MQPGGSGKDVVAFTGLRVFSTNTRGRVRVHARSERCTRLALSSHVRTKMYNL